MLNQKGINKIKWGLTLLLLVSTFDDIFTTLQHSNFLSLESNVLFNAIGSIWFIIAFKIAFILFLMLPLWMKPNRLFPPFPTLRFFYLQIIVLVIIGQFYAGFNNATVKDKITEDVNHRMNTSYTVSQVPAEIIKSNYTAPTEDRSQRYISLVGILVLFPLFISTFCFKIWSLIYYNPNNNEKKD